MSLLLNLFEHPLGKYYIDTVNFCYANPESMLNKYKILFNNYKISTESIAEDINLFKTFISVPDKEGLQFIISYMKFETFEIHSLQLFNVSHKSKVIQLNPNTTINSKIVYKFFEKLSTEISEINK